MMIETMLPLVAADDALPGLAGPARQDPVTIARVEIFTYRYPLETPVVTSFGIMQDRPAVLVRVEDADGAFGWGEIWCNFPACGAEHRARLLETEIAPRLLGHSFANPADATTAIEADLRVLALQTGEWGPLAQCIAGLDIALWDMAARRACLPLSDYLAGKPAVRRVAAYASGINRDSAEDMVARMRAQGYCAFKVKVGRETGRDIAVLRRLADTLGPGERLMADANQAWTLSAALDFAAAGNDLPLYWLEEPLPADRPQSEWRSLAVDCPFPLACGENLRGLAAFSQAAGSGSFSVLQPDICKWGGFTGCLPAARAILDAGLSYCPHFLGAGIGLVASAHLLAAAGGPGMLEIDVNDNPLRDMLASPLPTLGDDGQFPLHDGPGLHVTPDLAATRKWLVATVSIAESV